HRETRPRAAGPDTAKGAAPPVGCGALRPALGRAGGSGLLVGLLLLALATSRLEAGRLCLVGGLEPDLGHGPAAPLRTGDVVLLRVEVALDGVLVTRRGTILERLDGTLGQVLGRGLGGLLLGSRVLGGALGGTLRLLDDRALRLGVDRLADELDDAH